MHFCNHLLLRELRVKPIKFQANVATYKNINVSLMYKFSKMSVALWFKMNIKNQQNKVVH